MRTAPAWRMAARSICRNGSKRLATRPCGLYAVRPPVLARRIELVGRRADRQPAQHDALLHPGVGAAGIDADRGVEIEADREAAPPRDVAAAFELALGVPLQEFVKADLVGMAFPEPAQRVVGWACAIPPAIPTTRRNVLPASVSNAAKHSSARPRSCR